MILSINLFSHRNNAPNIADFEAVKAAGFTDVTLELNVREILLSDSFEKEIKKVKDALNSLNLTVSQTHLEGYSLTLGSSVTNAETDKLIDRTVIATAILGAPWGVLHPRTRFDAINDRKLNLEENIKFVTPLLKTAEKYGTGIAVENIPTWRDAEKNKFFSAHHQELIDLIDYFGGNKHIGICWDTGHANLNKHCDDQYQAIREIGHRLKATHIASNDGRYDDHLMPPAFGTVDCEKLASVLKEIKYDGVICCELHSSDIPETSDTYNKLSYACGEYLMDLLEK